MENMGENFANSCRREDKMLRQGEGWRIVLKRREKRKKRSECHWKKFDLLSREEEEQNAR